MVAPLALLADLAGRSTTLVPAERRPPAWWAEPAPAAASARPPTGAPAAPERVPAGYLFHPAPPEHEAAPPAPRPGASGAPSEADRPDDPPAWLGRLFASDAYRAQRQLVRRFAPGDDEVRQVLATLDRHGGAMTPIALAARANVPAARLDGLIAKLGAAAEPRRLRGAAARPRSASWSSWTLALLIRQFELE